MKNKIKKMLNLVWGHRIGIYLLALLVILFLLALNGRYHVIRGDEGSWYGVDNWTGKSVFWDPSMGIQSFGK